MRIAFSFVLVAACGAPPATEARVEAPAPLPTTSTSATAEAPVDPRSCDRLGAPIASPRGTPAAQPALAGQMTEESARAKRLFDAERWREAATALEHVASGASGDDIGNRQLAEYHLAIALYRMHDARGSYAVFRRIAGDRAHLKHAETILWLLKLLGDEPALVDFAAFATYERADADRFHNANQMPVWSAASFALGRERLQEGARAEAAAFFANVDPDGPFAPLLARCVALAR